MNELRKKLGELLKLERERQSLSLEDVSSQLKVPKSNLEHIEAGDADALPSELYFTLFAKSYAEALGIDYSRTVEAIKEDIGEPLEPQGHVGKGKDAAAGLAEASPEKQAGPVENQTRTGTKYLRTWISVFGVIVILFVIFMLVNKYFFGVGKAVPPAEEPTEATTERLPVVDRADSAQAVFAGYDWEVPPYQKPPDLQLKLIAKGESWATVFADGDTAVFRNLVAGRVYEVKAKYRLRVSIAVPSVVDVELNGQPVDLRNQTTRRISRVKINQMNLDSFLSSRESAAGTLNRAEGSDKNNTEHKPLSPTKSQPSQKDVTPSSGEESADLTETAVDSAGGSDDER